MGDFNWGEIKWETFENGGENTWGNKLLRLTMNNTIILCVIDYTRYRGDDKSMIYKEINLEKDINHECPLGRSDHVVLEIEIKGNIEDKQKESY